MRMVVSLNSRSTVTAYEEHRPEVTWAVEVPDEVAAAYLAALDAFEAAEDAIWGATAAQRERGAEVEG